MTVLVFGRSGQVATALGTHSGVVALGRAACDITVQGAVDRAVRQYRPKAVINAAAFTAVDQAEVDPDLAYLLNAAAVADMVMACAVAGIPLVHLSTDYVFDGSGDRPWQPDGPVTPLGVYGFSKAAGEQAVRAAGGVHAIVRTSWVFSDHGQNFVQTMLRLGQTRDQINVVSDQVGGPTAASDIAVACLTIAQQLCDDPSKTGTYHFSGTPDVSWAGFARTIFGQAGLACQVEDIATALYPTPAIRPLNSRLDCSATQAVFGVRRPNWQDTMNRIILCSR